MLSDSGTGGGGGAAFLWLLWKLAKTLPTETGEVAQSVANTYIQAFYSLWAYFTAGSISQTRDSNDVDWLEHGKTDKKANKANHILRGSNNRHANGWKKAGFDPKDPKSYWRLLPYLKQVYEKGKEGFEEGRLTYTMYVEKLKATIKLIMYVDETGNKVISDAYIVN